MNVYVARTSGLAIIAVFTSEEEAVRAGREWDYEAIITKHELRGEVK